MTMTDPIADMLTRIRNAQLATQHEVVLPYSKLKYAIAQLLEREGWIVGLAALEQNSKLKIILKYDQGKPVINHLKRISTPGRRVYVKRQDLPRVLNGLGTAIISTPRGLMTSDEARKAKLGGELLCELY
ncbi:MAG: 30S ribosomal protein S8 [Candidatus Kerfeldbacteria bacterium]|nr:30S ribosomal protein S8 [Candidatus Kerfeldbacteria bacterium]